MPSKLRIEQKSKSSSQKISRNQSPGLSSTSSVSAVAHFMSSKSLPIDSAVSDKNNYNFVPPSTPRELVPDVLVTPLPGKFPALKNVKLPIVKEVGVKESLRVLSIIFGCTEYHLNLIQFWFLDMLTDCVWRAQDEFRFPDRDQKIILEWILFTFDLIRAQHLNLSRKKLFSTFAEAVSIAEDHVEAGCPSVPLPAEIFSLKLCDRSEEISESSATSSCSESVMCLKSGRSAESLLAIKFQDRAKYFKLPGKTCAWDTDDECLSSSIESLTEDGNPEASEDMDISSQEEAMDDSLNEEIEFYKADMRTPPRFKMSSDESTSSISLESSISDDVVEVDPRDPSWRAYKSHFRNDPYPSEVSNIAKDEHMMTEEQKDEDAVQAWFDYHLWQLKKERLDNSRIGLYPLESENSQCGDGNNTDNEIKKIRMEMLNLLETNDEENERTKKNIFVNTCVLLAIKKFVFDYFYESFQYTLVKMAFRYPQHLITQEINQDWYMPKKFKSDLRKPQPKKMRTKKEKKNVPKSGQKDKRPKSPRGEKKDTKEKKDKGEKKEKQDKKDKRDKIKEKKSSKTGESSKKSAQDVKKRAKGDKAKEMSKSEMKEAARIRREEVEAEEQRKKAEENKRFLFPLTEAATDDFFQSIFENWVKPKAKGKHSKDKSSKSDTGSKKDKTSDKTDKSEGKSDAGKKKKERKENMK